MRLLHSAFLLLITVLTFPAFADWHSHDDAKMGTTISLEFWLDDDAQSQTIITESMQILDVIEQQMSPYIESSELSQINLLAFNEPVVVSESLFGLIQASLYYSGISGGAFDITFASIGKQYDYRAGKKPSGKVIQENLEAIDYTSLVLNPEKHSIRFKHQGTQIDLGGIAKGYAIDRVIEYLKSQGIDHAVVSAGGDTRIMGDKRGKPWMIGIRNPRNKAKSSLVIPLDNTAISTSGDYERFFEEDDIRYHHILDPETGYSPDSKIQSVSILGNDSTTTDALSTTVFVLGLEKGMKLVEKLEGIDAIIITEGNKIYFSSGLQAATQ